MNSTRIALTVFMIAGLCACGTVGRYEFSAITFFESLETRNDHTFSYGCSSDVIGDEYAAKGTWAVEDGGTLVTTVVSAEGSSDSCLKPVQRWQVTSKGVTAEGRNNLLRRKLP